MNNEDFIYDYEQTGLLLLFLGSFALIVGLFLLAHRYYRPKSKSTIKINSKGQTFSKSESDPNWKEVEDLKSVWSEESSNFTEWLKTKAKNSGWNNESTEPPV